MQILIKACPMRSGFIIWQQMYGYGTFYIRMFPLRILLPKMFSILILKQRNVVSADTM